MTNNKNHSFRDRIVTMNEEGRRNWIYANQPKGLYYSARTIVGIVLLAFFFAAPNIKLGGEPLLLFDIIHRKFVLFGVAFWPQDFHLFVIGLIMIIISIVTFTVVYGRVWCGWACPQTVFMEIVFRRIEYWIEGTGDQQRIRDNDDGDAFSRAWRKLLKHFIFIHISLLITHTMLSYFVGAETVYKYVTSSPSENFSVFVAIMIFTGAFYFVFAFFREQVCSLVCPYGRLQGALLDNNTLMVTYDYKRGEKRSPVRKGEDRKALGKGDCINCYKCKTVCPAGIDIRDGIQLECINCTACIDACNSVMKRYELPKGLIRITSLNNIEKGERFRWSPRVVAYTGLLVALLGVLIVLFNLRSDFETTILRVQGSLYQSLEDGRFSNIYNYKIVNKTSEEADLSVKLISPEGKVQLAGTNMKIKKQEKIQGAFLLILSRDQFKGGSTKVRIGIYNGDKLIDNIESTFVGPN